VHSADKKESGGGWHAALHIYNAPRYTGTTTEERPEANPMMSRAGMIQWMLGARLMTRPPKRNIQVLIIMAPLTDTTQQHHKHSAHRSCHRE
jgi:hypothetical protein